MAGKRIEYQELVDLDGYRKAIADARSDYKSWIDEAVRLNEQLHKSLQQSRSELDQMRKVNAGGDSAQQTDLAQRVATVGQQYKDQKAALSALTQTQQLHSQVTDSLIARQQKLITEYASLQGNTAKVVAEKKRLAKEMVALQGDLERVAKSSKIAADGTKTVQGQYNQLQTELAQARKELKALDGAFNENTGSINRNNAEAVRLKSIIDRNDTTLRKFDQTLGVHNRNIGNYPKSVEGVNLALTNLAMRFLSVEAAINGAKWFYGQSKDLEAYNKSLRAVSDSEADYAQSKQFLIDLADKLGVHYTSLIDKYKLLKDSTKDTALEGTKAQKIFAALTTTGAKLGLSNETIERTLSAVIQMVGKGTIQMEELKQQLGEHVPSALRLMAEALGVSQTKLYDMAKQGRLVASEVLPELGKSFEKHYGLKQNEEIEGLANSTARLTNEVDLLIETLNDDKAVTSFWDNFTSRLKEGLRNVRLFVKDGSWQELLQPFGPNSLMNKTAQRTGEEDAMKAFSKMGEGDRSFKLDEVREKLNALKKAYKTYTDEHPIKKYVSTLDDDLYSELKSTESILKQMEKVHADAAAAYIKERGQQSKMAKKDAAEKAEKELGDFQKKALKKRTEELIVLEKQLAKDPKNSALAEKLERYKKADAEIRQLDKETAARIKAERGKTEAQIAAERARLKAEKVRDYRDSLSIASSATGEQLSDLASKKESGVVSEQQFIMARYNITVSGINKRQELLETARKKELVDESEFTRQLAALDKERAKARADYEKGRADVQEKAFKLGLDSVKGLIEADAGEFQTQLTKRVADLTTAYSDEETKIKASVAKRQISEGEGEQRLADLRIQLLKDIANATASYDALTIQSAENRLNALADKMRAEGKNEIEIAQALNDEHRRLQNERNEAEKRAADNSVKINEAKNEKIVKSDEEARRKRDEILSKGAEVAIAAVSGYTDIVNGFRDQELARLEKQKAYELSLVGDNAEAKATIEAQFDAKSREIKRKQAIADKAAALFSIVINTAVNAAKIGLVNPILFALTIGLGAIQAAVVASKPIPEFWKGTSDAPEGPAWVAERGYELVESKQGGKPSYRLYADKQIAYLNAHDRVMTHHESKRLLNNQEIQQHLRVNTALAQEVRTAPGGSKFVQPIINGGLSKTEMREVMLETLGAQTVQENYWDDKGFRQALLKKHQHREWLLNRFSLPVKKRR